MHSDWLDNLDWLMLGLGIVVGVVGQTLMTVILIITSLSGYPVLILIMTQVMILMGGFVAAWRKSERSAKALNGIIAALVCAFVSLIASVSANPENGSNWSGLLFLFGSYTLMGALGALLTKLLLREQLR